MTYDDLPEHVREALDAMPEHLREQTLERLLAMPDEDAATLGGIAAIPPEMAVPAALALLTAHADWADPNETAKQVGRGLVTLLDEAFTSGSARDQRHLLRLLQGISESICIAVAAFAPDAEDDPEREARMIDQGFTEGEAGTPMRAAEMLARRLRETHSADAWRGVRAETKANTRRAPEPDAGTFEAEVRAMLADLPTLDHEPGEGGPTDAA